VAARLELVNPIRPVPQLWARLKSWRRISFTRSGISFTVGTFAVGLAAINTGNNLLHLLLGAMLGLLLLSGWLSERAIRKVTVERRFPHGLSAGEEARLSYRVHNGKRRLPSLSLEIDDEGLPGTAFADRVPAGGAVDVSAPTRFDRRGVVRLSKVSVSTTFPFGLFRKASDLTLPGELVVWPRTDHPLGVPTVPGRVRRESRPWRGPAGPRGEYRGLRQYRPGDDPRDIHWRSSARRETPVIREYDRDASHTVWICLDLGAQPGDAAEEMLEAAASLAARAMDQGRRFGLAAGERLLRPGMGPAHLESILDALARVRFEPHAPPPAPPAEPESCILVSLQGRGGDRFGDAFAGADLQRSDPP
jgi:uncharacterized protein (DUF58 family)